MLGYGNSAAYTQYSQNGTVLCDVHFGPGSQFSWGRIQSYRAFKFAWRGNPETVPAVRVMDEAGNRTSVYVSWNGDTEVVRWVVQKADEEDGDWTTVKTVRRLGSRQRLRC